MKEKYDIKGVLDVLQKFDPLIVEAYFRIQTRDDLNQFRRCPGALENFTISAYDTSKDSPVVRRQKTQYIKDISLKCRREGSITATDRFEKWIQSFQDFETLPPYRICATIRDYRVPIISGANEPIVFRSTNMVLQSTTVIEVEGKINGTVWPNLSYQCNCDLNGLWHTYIKPKGTLGRLISRNPF